MKTALTGLGSMDLAGWLEQQGLAQFEPKLREAGIDLDVMGDLENDDLTEIGLNLGDRKRLLKAIAAALPSTTPGAVKQISVAPAEANLGAEERRQLTVTFCDLVGSTALSAALDPEDLRAVLRNYHDAVASAVGPYEGHVAQFLGDGVLVYFGYPKAHEDDAVRAVRAALAVINAVAQLKAHGDARLQARIGIATGPVVLGQIGAGTPAAELSAIGGTPNLAARLQALAQPGEIVIAPETRRLIGASFELISAGPQSLKGIEKSVEPWRVVGERAVSSRFEAEHAHELTQFVGRKGELSTLVERWSMAREGEGQVVLLSGEAGIGKSRISQTLRELLKQDPSTTLLWQCSPYFISSALYPLVQQLERAAGIVPADAPEARSGKLERALAPTGLDRESMGYVLKLLGLPDGGRLPAGQTPQQEKSKTLKALIDTVLGLARQQPILLLLEDAHWIDPTTEELLTLAIERLRDARALILVTSRPEYSANWGNPTNLTRLALSRLGQRQSAALIDSITGAKALPEEVVSEIVRKTDGIPLFVEELTKTVIESGLLRQTDIGYELKGSLSALAIPSTLQDSLMARLDRLAPAKVVAQVGAAIGRVFSHQLLAAVLQMPETKLNEAIDDLVESELLFCHGPGPDSIYTFKHALVRDTAYNSMVKSQRALRHDQIAKAILRTEPDALANQPALLAFHHQEAGDASSAFWCWCSAGDQAVKRSTFPEGVTHFQAAMAQFNLLRDLERTPELERGIQMKLGNALMYTVGYNAPETQRCFARALEISKELEDLESYLSACGGVAMALYADGRFKDVLALFERIPAADLGAVNVALQVTYHVSLGVARYYLGHFTQAWQDIQQALTLCRSDNSVRDATMAGLSLTILAYNYAAILRLHAGKFDEARDLAHAYLAASMEIEHAPTKAFAHGQISKILKDRGEFLEAERHARLSLEIAERLGTDVRISYGLIRLGHAKIATARVKDGTTDLRSGYAIWERAGGKFNCADLAASGAHELLAAGSEVDAAEFVAKGEHFESICEERVAHAELIRLRGRLAELGNRFHEAEEGYRRALEVAIKQGSSWFALRAATDLARLLNLHGRHGDAIEVLDPVLGAFSEGFDHPELVRAKNTRRAR